MYACNGPAGEDGQDGQDGAPGEPVTGAEVATPSFSIASGSFYDSVEVGLSPETVDADLRYTTDGSTPNESSTLYTATFTLTSSATVRAIALREGRFDSPVAESSYAITRRLYVSEAHGDDGDDGSRDNPFASIEAANGAASA